MTPLPTAAVVELLNANGRPVKLHLVQTWGRRHPRLVKRFGLRSFAWDEAGVNLLAEGYSPEEAAARLEAADQAEGV